MPPAAEAGPDTAAAQPSEAPSEFT